jgi:hypothetical protein
MRKRVAVAGAVVGTATGIAFGRTVGWWRTWGVDRLESAKALPGDGLVPTPTAIETRGITIDAPPEAVWPWLVQMGYGRAGWYSYDQLDMRGSSADRIVPAWQGLEVGDVMPNAPGSGFAVRTVEPGRALVLFADTALVASQAAERELGSESEVPAGLAASGAMLRQTPQDFAASWAFALEPLEGGGTRLIERFRVRFGAASPAFRVVAPVMGFGVFAMMRRQMLGLRERAQRTAVVVTPPLPEAIVPTTPVPEGRSRVRANRTDLVAAAAI